MPSSDDIRASLPERPFGASDQAWSDICAEIEDHLAEAYDEALETNDGDKEEALNAALSDLGHEPAQMARRLWWDSLGGSWLRAWVQTIAIVILVTVLSIVSVRLFVEFSAVARQGSEMLSAIPKDLSASFLLWRSVRFDVHRGSAQGPLLPDVAVSLTGRPFKNDYEPLQERTSTEGNCSFGPIRVGQYEVHVEDPDFGVFWQRDVILYPVEDAGAIDLILPEAAPTRLRFQAPQAALNAVAGLLVEAEVRPNAKSDWVAPLYVAISEEGARRASQDSHGIPISRLIQAAADQTGPYAFETAALEQILLEAGGFLQIVSVRVLDEQGFASKQRFPLEGKRRFTLEPGTTNTVSIPISDAIVPLVQTWSSQ